MISDHEIKDLIAALTPTERRYLTGLESKKSRRRFLEFIKNIRGLNEEPKEKVERADPSQNF